MAQSVPLYRLKTTFPLLVGLLLGFVSQAAAQLEALSRPEPKQVLKAAWRVPSAPDVSEQVLRWLQERGADDALLDMVRQNWEAIPSSGVAETVLLEELVATIALVDPQTQVLLDTCSRPLVPLAALPGEWLADESLPGLLRDNVRLYYARWLAQARHYDEALAQITDLEPGQVVAPATLLFYQAVCHHRLINRDAGLAALATLEAGHAPAPERYRMVASLMKEDLKDLEDDSLDHIARRMADVQRRLDLGRASTMEMDLEQDVINSLDKLIEQIEQQQQQQQQQQQAAAAPSAQPMDDSRIALQKGPGEVDAKPLGNKSGWGDLPPKEREAALQQITQQYPAHYRDAIEQYFRRSAQRGEQEAADN